MEIDEFVKRIPNKKESWMNVARSWELLRTNELSEEAILDWFMRKYIESITC